MNHIGGTEKITGARRGPRAAQAPRAWTDGFGASMGVASSLLAMTASLFGVSCARSAAGPGVGDVAPPSAEEHADSAPASRGSPTALGAAARAGEKASAGRPVVVVELFSSEGCSSCPPADVVLRDLAAKQPVDGAEILALEMHVDYWNDLGWRDPFSAEEFTSRQRAYGRVLGDRSIYTPQMVVDGRVGFIGSQRDTAESAIGRAVASPKAKVTVARDGDRLSITVADIPAAAPAAEVLLALTEEGLSSDVKRGENAGAVLAHGPVVRALTRLGRTSAEAPGAAFQGSETVTLDAGWRRDKVRAVVLVQAVETRAILGAGWVSMSSTAAALGGGG